MSTNVIFISGFQNFSYAQDAIKYGAVNYLLKPVMEDELMGALEKCIRTLQKEQIPLKKNYGEDEREIPFERLNGMEHTTYLPAVIRVFYEEKETAHARKLIHFSVYSYLEQQLQNENAGVIFEKTDR